MSIPRVSDLEALLRFPGGSGQLVDDAVLLNCGCLALESAFVHYNRVCPNCKRELVSILKEVQPLRDLYQLVKQIRWQLNERKLGQYPVANVMTEGDRLNEIGTVGKSMGPPPSSGMNSTSPSGRRWSSDKRAVDGEPMDLISLFYKFAKEEEMENSKSTGAENVKNTSVDKSEQLKNESVHFSDLHLNDPHFSLSEPIDIKSQGRAIGYNYGENLVGQFGGNLVGNFGGHLTGHNFGHIGEDHGSVASYEAFLEPQLLGDTPYALGGGSFLHSPELTKTLLYENNLLKGLNEEKEYNFSKCFPLYRKLTTYLTQQNKFNLQSAFKLTSMLKKAPRFIGSSIHTQVDIARGGVEVTRFALITDKRWELWEYLNTLEPTRPQLLCCGKASGEYGPSPLHLNMAPDDTHEIRITNDFSSGGSSDTSIKKKLSLWDFLHCQLSENYLVISGTKGLLRVFNIWQDSPYEMGQPVYTYSTNFPIRCMAVSLNNSLAASGINARERVSGKEQPFVILHRFLLGPLRYLQQVDPITITIPYRDPIKLVVFNPSSTHLLCATVWESRYLIIKLRSNDSSENYRKPRLIWSEVAALKSKGKLRRSGTGDTENTDGDGGNFGKGGVDDGDEQKDSEVMMSNEGITDLQFGSKFLNSLIITLCSLQARPPLVIRLHGASMDSAHKRPSMSDSYSVSNSMNSFDEEEDTSIQSSEVLLRLHEVGSSIHRCALSPRGDGIVFVTKEGAVFLVSVPNFMTNTSARAGDHKGTHKITANKVVVQLGEVANAERFSEAASVRFAADGGKVFMVDRKGVFSVFDFTKGIPGEDNEVIKCRIVNI